MCGFGDYRTYIVQDPQKRYLAKLNLLLSRRLLMVRLGRLSSVVLLYSMQAVWWFSQTPTWRHK